MAVAYYYTNTFVQNAISNSGGISLGATSFYCTQTPTSLPPGYPFKLVLDEGESSEEVVKVLSGNGTSLSPFQVVRGWDGTTAVSHDQNATVIHGATAEDFSLAAAHEAASSASATLPHGLPAAAWLTSPWVVVNETVLTTSTQTVVTWNSIPTSYSHLLVAVTARSNSSTNKNVEIAAIVNGDTASRYSGVSIESTNTGSGIQAVPDAAEYQAQGQWNWFMSIAGAQAGGAVNIGGGFCFLPNYSGTVTNKMFVGLSGYGNGTSQGATARTRFGWYNPASQAAITSLSLQCTVGSYMSGAFFGLYAFGG